jgi:phenylpropionate dioxygenase-like ring-hydroxylating dioxygenase large terminal subunit
MNIARPSPHTSTFPGGDRAVLAKCWHPVARSDEVGFDRPLSTRVLDESVVLYRTSTGLAAAADVCPHRGAPLSLGAMVEDTVACPYHGHRFNGAGRCIHIPAQPAGAIPAKLALRCFETTERFGLIWVCLDPPASVPLPELAPYGRDGFQAIHIPAFDWACSAGRQIEAIGDVAHFAFVHPLSLVTEDSVVSPYTVEVTGAGIIRAEFTSRVANTTDRSGTAHNWRRAYHLTLPFTIQVEITFPNQGTFVIFNTCCPVSARLTRVFAIVCRNFDLEKPVSDVVDFQMRVYAEDQRIVERQTPDYLPLDLTAEVHLKADRISVEYRKQLTRLGMGRD